MENKRILFVTFDMSGYYDGVHAELKRRYSHIDYYNTAKLTYRYRNLGEKLKAAIYKVTTGKKLKNFYKLRGLTEAVSRHEYDIAIIVRPDLFFDTQLDVIRQSCKRCIAYYHDSINNIPRKKDVIRYFDRVFSYEKKDVRDYNLAFLPNFIYFDPDVDGVQPDTEAFSVMSYDYRFPVLEKIALQFRKYDLGYRFFVMDDKRHENNLVTFMTRRMNNAEVTTEIKKANTIVDVHKFGVQDGLTFRTFEALGYKKKLITTNQDIANYDFYDQQNIFIANPAKDIEIPQSFFTTPYRNVPSEIVEKYTVSAWLDKILAE